MEMTRDIDETAYARALDEFPPHPIWDDAGNEKAIAMLKEITSLENPTTELRAIAEILVTLIETYEQRYAIEAASPLDTMLELMAANDLKQKDMSPGIASKGVMSQVIRGIRPITKGMAHKLGQRFHVSHTLFL
jgi:antitoxin component HigA of HigAB toxin-antitoxin module